MKVSPICFLFLTAVSGLCFAQGERDSERPIGGPPPELLQRFDKDDDGQLNDDERAALRAEMGDRPSRPEGGRGGPGGAGGPGGPGRGGPGGEKDLELVAKFDRDSDGVLNTAERAEARKFVKESASQGGRRGGGGGGGRGPGGRGGPGASEENAVTPRPGEKLTPDQVAQYPDADLYEVDVIQTIFLDFESDDWESELEDFSKTDVEVPARLTIDGKTLEHPVGLSFRGNSSLTSVRSGSKRSFNLKADTYADGQRVKGYKTLNLLNGHADPSVLREVLFSHVASRYLPTAKANWVKVVINGESWGIYVNSQQFNKDFLKEHYGTSEGNRWKVPVGFNGGFRDLGDDLESYKAAYELKTKAGDEAWESLAALCRTLKNATAETALETLAPILDVDEALWSLAVDNVFQDGDGYLSRTSDYVFYEDPDHRFHVLPYDSNETFITDGTGGGPGVGRSSGGRRGARGSREQSAPYGREPLMGLDDDDRPLAKALLAVPALRARYLDHIRVITEDWLSWEKLGPVVERFHHLIADEVAKDTRKLYSTEAFEQSITEDLSLGSHSAPGLKSFVEGRAAFLKNHKELATPVPTVRLLTTGVSVEPGAAVPVQARVDGKPAAAGVILHVRTGGKGVYADVPMKETDGIYSAELPAAAAGTLVEYYVEARTASDGAVSFAPRYGESAPESFRVAVRSSEERPAVVFNELMAKNNGTIADPQGEFDDWIELHNRGEQTLDLTGYKLSDDGGKLDKWIVPNGTTIAPGGYLLIWADDGDAKGEPGLHANFKLSSSGEVVVLSDPEGNVLDVVKFGSLGDGESYAREGDEWNVQSPTPGQPNRASTAS
ncbi:MAG: CotH kinase family protein [Verrucomicrobiota bacterium JB025]|nr:CotH kinase family protein [Verrucomicrobiota bacterium JB025]